MQYIWQSLSENFITKLCRQAIQKFQLTKDAVDYLATLCRLDQIDKRGFKQWLAIFGCTTITYAALKMFWKTYWALQWMPKHILGRCMLSEKAFKKKYGDCWVVITGFADGIGWAYTKIFASMNYNLILIDRSEPLAKLKVAYLKDYHPNVQTECIIKDLSKKEELSNLINTLDTLSRNVDIGIFINNAGVSGGGLYDTIQPSTLFTTVKVNFVASTLITQSLFPAFQDRNHKSAIVNMTSATSVYLSPRLGAYAASKKMVSMFAQNLQQFQSKNIDIIVCSPYGVITRMMKMKKSEYMISPQDCVKSTLGDLLLGQKKTFSGAYHKIIANSMQSQNEFENMVQYDKTWKKNRQEEMRHTC